MTARRNDASWSALFGLEKLLDHRVRLAICVLLTRNDALSFSRLKSLLDQTDGSLGAHLRKLEDAGFVSVDKAFRDRRPVTWYAITPQGADRVRRHVDSLESILDGRSVPPESGAAAGECAGGRTGGVYGERAGAVDGAETGSASEPDDDDAGRD